MAKITESGGREFKLLPAGSHAAVCTIVAHMGLQNSAYMGKPKIQPKVYLRWQIPGERVEWEKDGQTHEGPMSIGQTYTESLSEKANLRKALESWRSRAFTQEELAGFELFNVLGKPCMLSVVHDMDAGGKTRAYIQGVSALPKGMPAPKAEGDLLKYDAEHPGDFDKLPEWLRTKINEQVKQQTNGHATHPAVEEPADDFGDSIPF